MPGRRMLKWGLLGFVARRIARFATARSVDTATDELTERLPARAAEVLPDQVLRAGGAALAGGRATRKAAKTSATAAGVARTQGRQLKRGADRVNALVGRATGRADDLKRRAAALDGRVRGEVTDAVGDEERGLRSAVMFEVEGRTAADDALLDLRNRSAGVPAEAEDPSVALPSADDEVGSGRWRGAPFRAAKRVERVQRNYLRPVKDWDRPNRER